MYITYICVYIYVTTIILITAILTTVIITTFCIIITMMFNYYIYIYIVANSLWDDVKDPRQTVEGLHHRFEAVGTGDGRCQCSLGWKGPFCSARTGGESGES